MKKPLLFSMCCGILVCTVCAEVLYLKQDRTGEVHGPYRMEKGAKIVIGSEEYTVVIKEPAEVEKKLSELRVPSVRFERATLEDVLNFLHVTTIELDPDKTGVNFVLLASDSSSQDPQAPSAEPAAGPDSAPRVTLRMRDVSALQVLSAIMDQTGRRYKTSENTVTILPKE